jgi:transposase, IS30 family
MSAPWQPGINESTNGLLRKYFPEGTDLSALRAANWTGSLPDSTTDPAKRLGYRRPIEKLGPLLLR